MNKITYFSYGSNMYEKRLLNRTPSAIFVSIGVLEHHVLNFSKKGADDSSKCHIVNTPSRSDYVYGVLYQINKEEIFMLDKAEGLGYGYLKKDVIIRTNNKLLNAFTYYAHESFIIKGMLPYKWYLNFVIEGAKEHNFPVDYIRFLEKFEYIKDLDINRRKLNGKIISTN
jgi:gamma-glutamylcyclotransferase